MLHRNAGTNGVVSPHPSSSATITSTERVSPSSTNWVACYYGRAYQHVYYAGVVMMAHNAMRIGARLATRLHHRGVANGIRATLLCDYECLQRASDRNGPSSTTMRLLSTRLNG